MNIIPKIQNVTYTEGKFDICNLGNFSIAPQLISAQEIFKELFWDKLAKFKNTANCALNILFDASLPKEGYKIVIDKNIYKAKMLKLLLQPLVENSMIHGVEKKNK
ncbi:MAG: hypothetical protein RR123_06530, partial [Clostridia bacterium]